MYRDGPVDRVYSAKFSQSSFFHTPLRETLMPPAPETLRHRISLGSAGGRRAFLNLWLKALKNNDTIEIDRLSDLLDNDIQHWPEFDQEVVKFVAVELHVAVHGKTYHETSLSQHTMTRIVTGGKRGRNAFLSLVLKAAFEDDRERIEHLLKVILERIWVEQDRAGSDLWPEEDRNTLRFILQEIGEALSIDEE
jgi:hypothetical protein